MDGILRIPETIGQRPVTELAGYIFSDTVRGQEPPPGTYEGEEAVCGAKLKELTLPEGLKKIGAYAFYNCYDFRKLSCYSTVEDWGAGVFTGCSQLDTLEIRIAEGRKSCFKEILSELHQTLVVNWSKGEGTARARLIFPEFYEESVENTPARIIMREMHGCGHMYRYCFDGGDFNFQEYDRLFPYVKPQEKPGLVALLALYRLYWPWGLSDKAKDDYQHYIRENAGEGARELLLRGEGDILRWLAGEPFIGLLQLDNMIKEAAGAEDAGSLAFLMDMKHRRFRDMGMSKRTFEL